MKSRRLLSMACAGLMLATVAACQTPPTNPPTTTTTPGGGGGGDYGGIEPSGTLPQDSPPTPSGCITNVGPSDRMEISGCNSAVANTYVVTVPPVCLEKKCGLIFDIHGMAMNADNQNDGFNMRALGKKENYIIVEPQSNQFTWDFGSGAQSPAVADFLDLAVKTWKVDTRRVHSTGYSMGGSMTWWLRCHKSNVLASVAPYSFNNNSGGQCPQVTIPTFYQMGGTSDALSGDTGGGTIAYMLSTYGLSNPTVVASVPDGYTWNRYKSATGFEFETIVHNYKDSLIQGHCMYGSPNPSSIFSCDGTQPIHAGELIMNFFKAHPKK
jgi:hypothetical protein